MQRDYTVKDLSYYFNLSQQTLYKYLNEFEKKYPQLITRGKHNKYLVADKGLQYFKRIINENQIILNKELLKFIICNEIENLCTEKNNYILQFTKRTQLKTKRNKTEFNKLPEFIKNHYQKFALKVISWLKTKFLSEDLTKIIIDWLPNQIQDDKDNTDIRITLYESNHPYDLNLIINKELNNLCRININKLKTKLISIKGLKSKTNVLLKDHDNFLNNLSILLNEIEDKHLIKRIFKLLIGSNSNYKIMAKPEAIILDFTKIELPTELETTFNQGKLNLSFNNGCYFICQLIKDRGDHYLIINFKEFPKDLELISL